MKIPSTVVDCEKCRNYDSELCDECEHYERDLYDYYQPYSDKELAEMERERWRKLEDELIDNAIEIDPAEMAKLAAVFEAAKQFRGNEYNRKEFISIRAESDHLSACNTHVLAQLYCDVPPAVRGKNIIRIEGGKIFIHNGKVPWEGRTLESLTKANKRALLSGAVIKEDSDWEVLKSVVIELPGEKITLNKKYFDLVRKVLEGEITVVYGGRHDAVIFDAENGKVLVMPLRTVRDVSEVEVMA